MPASPGTSISSGTQIENDVGSPRSAAAAALSSSAWDSISACRHRYNHGIADRVADAEDAQQAAEELTTI